MIVKTIAHSSPRKLAQYLLSQRDNEKVIEGQSRGGVQKSLLGGMAEFELMAKGVASGQPIYHAMVNPDRSMSDHQWERVWSLYEEAFNLTEQPWREVIHVKDGREHRHRAYYRCELGGKGRLVDDMSFSKVRDELVSRCAEHEFGHDLTLGAHNKMVIKFARERGRAEVADWLHRAQAHEVERPIAEQSLEDHQKQQRSGIDGVELKRLMVRCFETTDSATAFRTALAEEGLVLARGDSARFVVLDQAGDVHRVRGPKGDKTLKARVLKERLAPIMDELPDVDGVREALRQREQETIRESDQPSPDRPSADLESQANVEHPDPATQDRDISPDPETGRSEQPEPEMVEDGPEAVSTDPVGYEGEPESLVRAGIRIAKEFWDEARRMTRELVAQARQRMSDRGQGPAAANRDPTSDTPGAQGPRGIFRPDRSEQALPENQRPRQRRGVFRPEDRDKGDDDKEKAPKPRGVFRAKDAEELTPEEREARQRERMNRLKGRDRDDDMER
jgi:hypothetical protein